MLDDKDNFAHQQLHERVSGWLRAAILSGEIKAGEWIRQKRIAEELGVSQMPVREALKELAAEGLVEHIPYRGVRVIRFSLEDVADLFAQRACLEAIAARTSASIITKEEIDRLRTVQEEMEASLEPEDVDRYRSLNRQFHQILYRASKREYLIRTLDQMWSAFPSMLFGDFSRTSSILLPSRESTDIQEHRAIIEALEARDPDRAERAMQVHIDHAGSDLVTYLNAKNEKEGV
jgi:DNA-binding GntR family transcriptional regulator